MSVPVESWDETSPAGNTDLNLGDNRIRQLKTQIRQVIDVDHKFNSSGSDDDNGCHDQVTLLEKADIGSGAVGKTILGSQTVSGKGELVYTDEDDNDIVLTKDGRLRAASLGALDETPSDTLFPATVLAAIYPIGIVITLGVATNPATLFGFGTWTAIAGRVIVGIDATQTEFDALNETGGAKTHTLTESEIPTHDVGPTFGEVSNLGSSSGGQWRTDSVTKESFGGGGAHNNLQPYIVKYVWERTA